MAVSERILVKMHQGLFGCSGHAGLFQPLSKARKHFWMFADLALIGDDDIRCQIECCMGFDAFYNLVQIHTKPRGHEESTAGLLL
mmetsp:Transcript_18882/g.45249  ORF Transcript_18882/g.45249 Transcript_18882/m.45249 type:complete len:85 (-) Transcript_18882:27-281(-)